MLAWQTEEFLELRDATEGHVVHVRPELVVEIAFNEVQATRYPGGMALRFARVLRYRDDKRAAEADAIDDAAGAALIHLAGDRAGSAATARRDLTEVLTSSTTDPPFGDRAGGQRPPVEIPRRSRQAPPPTEALDHRRGRARTRVQLSVARSYHVGVTQSPESDAESDAPVTPLRPDRRRSAAAERRRQRESAIIAATRELFDARGVRDAQIDDVAKAVGVNRAIIYRHFSGKEELFALTLVGYLRELGESMTAAQEGLDADPATRLRTPWPRRSSPTASAHPAFVDCGVTVLRMGPELLDELQLLGALPAGPGDDRVPVPRRPGAARGQGGRRLRDRRPRPGGQHDVRPGAGWPAAGAARRGGARDRAGGPRGRGGPRRHGRRPAGRSDGRPGARHEPRLTLPAHKGP